AVAPPDIHVVAELDDQPVAEFADDLASHVRTLARRLDPPAFLARHRLHSLLDGDLRLGLAVGRPCGRGRRRAAGSGILAIRHLRTVAPRTLRAVEHWSALGVAGGFLLGLLGLGRILAALLGFFRPG